ncbi:LarB [Enterococcus phage vB_EfaM_Ef2.3]|uniref:LarB n=2 Tax=Kochikohdavirus TaxID=2560160 RepID=A0A4D6DUF6_9CAUD|nr:LarB [Enterococcus phage vB_EfaM_Ef2.3]QPW37323.1 1-(5-phosphoribosyl)-5-amino-4-imidazole-carboxylate carboxylase [Enterococcus phage PBEF129]
MNLRTLFGGNKTAQGLAEQIAEVPYNTNIMITKLPLEVFNEIPTNDIPMLARKVIIDSAEEYDWEKEWGTEASFVYCRSSETAFYQERPVNSDLAVAITSAGVADRDIVDEVYLTVLLSGYVPVAFHDIGVNDLNKLMYSVEGINDCNAIVSVQGFEGALPVVLAGLTNLPIVAVPTSTGYGISADGYTALNTALTSCTSGIAVVNIDNGFGGGAMAVRILEQISLNIAMHNEIYNCREW